MPQQVSQSPQSSPAPYRPLLNIYDLIDRVLDKGLVIDANVSVALVGIEILVVRARVVVAGIDTFLRYATALGLAAPISQNGGMIEMQPSG
jgi:gas vesicle structural protein